MRHHRVRFVLPAALLAAVVLLAGAPLHALHGHDDGGAASTVHAPCAVCQAHAPVGALPDVVAGLVEPDGFGRCIESHDDFSLPDSRADINACRAPPLLLAA
jgi:hypothetical protein